MNRDAIQCDGGDKHDKVRICSAPAKDTWDDFDRTDIQNTWRELRVLMSTGRSDRDPCHAAHGTIPSPASGLESASETCLSYSSLHSYDRRSSHALAESRRPSAV
jgi:hypothetical protein